MTTLDFRRFRVLTFDCYGTLIDWEAGILAGLQPVLRRQGLSLPDESVLERFARYEAQAETAAYQNYKDVLRSVAEQFGADLGFDGVAERNVLVDTFDGWKPFSDTVAALQALQTRYKLAILSNVDDDLFTRTTQHLPVRFDLVMTAEQIGSYKPSQRNFEYLLQHVGVPKDQVLHVAQSLYHDIAPARALGIATVWVNRRHAKPGSGATMPAQAQPDQEVPDLRTLADQVQQSFASQADSDDGA